MKKRKFLVSTLAAAGFLPASSVEAAISAGLPSNPFNADSDFNQRLELEQKYTLAGHRSHSSHSSHRSHRSSSTGGYTTTRPAVPVQPRSNSTSPRSVLPSLPNAQAVAPLPGNSEKFKQIAMRVQLGLISYGYYNGAVDGVIGKQSKAALSRFQSDYGLKVTGTVTPEVLNALGIAAQ
ncbi:His-Xaa-Ser repeat protein HxsA [Parasedimentitalea maritima]|uniref:His-Xaa-Ser repeat protein HxsA n=1 Tax=Parasedimentitalea maritima TaxID=2578117 RepID=A0A6A4RE87_9RHOB|nr:His-Xaa-Ser repeat protein HxsA [Zongyanglinia marina]